MSINSGEETIGTRKRCVTNWGAAVIGDNEPEQLTEADWRSHRNKAEGDQEKKLRH